MKYNIRICEQGIEPVVLSEKDLFYENATPTGRIQLYAMYTNEHGDSWTDEIKPGDIAGEIERCIENHGNGVDIILMYEYYDTEYSGTIGLYPDSVGYTPILSMRWSKDGEIETPDIKGHGFYYMDDELQKLYNLIDKAEDIARQALKRLNDNQDV